MKKEMEIYTEDLIDTAVHCHRQSDWNRLSGMIVALEFVKGAEDISKAVTDIYYADDDNELDEVLADLKEKGLWRC